MAKSKIAGLKAQREKVETADAIRLQLELAKATCESCGQKPKVYATRGDKRYIRCGGCGRTGQVVVERGFIRYKKMLTPEEFAAVMAAEEPAPEPDEPDPAPRIA